MLKWLWRILIGFGALGLLLVILISIAYLAVTPDGPLSPTVANDPELPYIEIDGYRFHAETFGDPASPVVIVLHGGPGGDYLALLDLKALSDEYFVVFYDQRSAGLSPRDAAEVLTMEQYLEDLDDIVEKFSKGRRAYLIGHSFGGMLASAYLGKHSEKVAGAVLAEPGFLNPEMGQQFMERTNWMMPTGIGLGDMLEMGKIWLESLKLTELDGHEHLDYLFSRVMKMDVEGHPIAGYFCGGDNKNAHLPDWRFGALVSQTMLAATATEDKRVIIDFSQGIDQFDREVLFIAGSCNTLIGEALQREHMKLFKKATLEVIEDAGHTMFGEQPERSLRVVREYLARAGQPEPGAEQAEITTTP